MKHENTARYFLAGWLTFGWAAIALGAAELPPAASRPVDFVKDIQPILSTACIKCHGPEKQKNGFRVDVKSVAMKGGDTYGVAIMPGKSAESPMIRYVAGLEDDVLMPPKGERLTAEQIGLLRAWIDQGADWPESASAKIEDPVLGHWAFKPIVRPAIPETAASVKNPIDAFVLAKLREEGLAFSPEADRRTLIRRLYFILDGLPPTPEEVAAFVADPRPDAYERLVDQLLASPHYGECWGRHWLDVIPFGETHGFEVNTPRENAWPYRDYVIQAFNRDTPYPRFMLEQLAGDTVGADAATGFIVAAAALLPGQVGKDEESKLKARQDELNDMISDAGGAFLGLTLHCARCHDHKFDPVTQSDYYSIQAIFAGVRHGERALPTPDWETHKAEAPAIRTQLDAAEMRLLDFEPLASVGGGNSITRVAVNPRLNVDRFAPVLAQKVRFEILATSENNRFEPCLDELEIFTAGGSRRNVALASGGAKVSASGTYPNSSKHRLEHLNDGIFGNSRSWISDTLGKGWVEVEFAQPETIDTVRWSRDRDEKFQDRLAVQYRIEVAAAGGEWQPVASSDDRAPSREEKASKSRSIPPGLDGDRLAAYHVAVGEVTALTTKLRSLTEPPMVYAGQFQQPALTHKLYRGDAMQPREQVTPGAVTAIGPPLRLPADAPEQERRVAFARWLGDPKNPLPARVLVNRLWQYHFGEGIVSTPNDFGHNGARPTHPELLDWLASEFISSGWSIKHLQRLIVLSATWRQASAPRPDGMQRDAGSRLLWRFPPRRLDAEAIRDEMLSAAGTLDLRMGGPGFSAFAPNFNYVRVYDPKPGYGPEDWRRMVYQTKVRMAQDSTFGAFDCPDAGQSSPKRSRSTTPLQALNLFNSTFVNQQADFFAARLHRDVGDDIAVQVRRGFQLVFDRDPASDESRFCERLARDHGLRTLCRVLLNSNEFLFIP